MLKAASKLQWLKENWEPTIAAMEDPLTHNRQVWTIFLDAATDPQSPMPPQMRSNMIGLCRFVINQCMRMLFEPDPKKLDLMIEINQHIAAGLRGREGVDLPSTEARSPELATS